MSFLEADTSAEPSTSDPGQTAPAETTPQEEGTTGTEGQTEAPKEEDRNPALDPSWIWPGRYQKPEDLINGYKDLQRKLAMYEKQLKQNRLDPVTDEERLQREILETNEYVKRMRFEALKEKVLAEFPGFDLDENIDAIERELELYDPAIRATRPDMVLRRSIKAVILEQGKQLPGSTSVDTPPQTEGATAGSGPSKPADEFDELIELQRKTSSI